jgi:putative lipoic acid-binding regulatory protein
MTEIERPKIEFPCDYPIKIMGYACDELHSHVHDVMDRHAPGFDREAVTIRDSRNGRFQSITVTITATGEEQLKAIFADMKTCQHVQMVL